MGPAIMSGRNLRHIEVVPCCAECNRTLGTYPLSTVRDRAAFLVEQYDSRDVSEERRSWVRGVALLD